MTDVDIKIPGMEHRSGVIVRWYKDDGDMVRKGEEIAEVMMEKATVRIRSPADGKLRILKKEDEEISEGEIIGKVEQ